MSVFVQAANFPHRCNAVVYGKKYAGILKKPLDSLKIDSILIPNNPVVDPRLSGHADLSVLHAGETWMFLAPYLKGSAFARDLSNAGATVVFPRQEQGACYPSDAMLNVCVMGDHGILNPYTAAGEIVDFLTIWRDNKLILCKQGYARCAICPVDKTSLITADRGVAKVAAAAGLSVLLISDGFVRLDGFPYGFLGGAAFQIADHKLAFTGLLDGHPDRQSILDFLAIRGVEPIFLTGDAIFDIGTAIPLFEDSQ